MTKGIHRNCKDCGRGLTSYSSRVVGYCGMCDRTNGRKRITQPNGVVARPGFIMKGCKRNGKPCPNCGVVHPNLRGKYATKNRIDGYLKKVHS